MVLCIRLDRGVRMVYWVMRALVKAGVVEVDFPRAQSAESKYFLGLVTLVRKRGGYLLLFARVACALLVLLLSRVLICSVAIVEFGGVLMIIFERESIVYY
eukprot:TRINITY_DN3450_c0_g1_i1.p1 TRINITY_DN3450_c0_g1~~TRINITY_DN3450_c0_g1_i1.p1  ORF type:complete len:101 (+),score=6.97 TRINITY_DN3450_c0_g1_i1:412-714(+)